MTAAAVADRIAMLQLVLPMIMMMVVVVIMLLLLLLLMVLAVIVLRAFRVMAANVIRGQCERLAVGQQALLLLSHLPLVSARKWLFGID